MIRAGVLLTTLIAGCATSSSGEPPESKLSCARGVVASSSRSSADRVMAAASDLGVAKAGFVKSQLSAEHQAALDAATTKEQLQALALDALARTQYSHKYSFSGPGMCALTKSYEDGSRESVCVQPEGAEHGNDGQALAIRQGEATFRKTITGWSLRLKCEGQRCAVVADGRSTKFKDQAFFSTSFKDESTSLLAVKALNKLGQYCAQ